MSEKQVKVALWCVPRSLSTVFAKCLSDLDEMEVYMELYSYAAAANGIFRTVTGRELPKMLEGNEADYAEAVRIWKETSKSTLIPRRVSCHAIQKDLEDTNSKYVLMKEMAYIIDEVKEYLPRGFKYVFLTRDPSRVFASYRKTQQNVPYLKVDGEIDIIRDDPAHVLPMTWYEKQHKLWKYVKENFDPSPVIIDAFDLCSKPEKILQSFCDTVGFPFNNNLPQWSPSTEFPKNFITAGEDFFEPFSVLYSAAFRSTYFKAAESGPISRDELTDDVIRCVDHSMPFYQEMYENRLIV